MAITVTHSKVSTIPDGDDTSVVRPSDWNADHQLVGTVPVANGGTGAATLTGYVKGNGTSTMTASATIPSTDVTGLGTMSTQNSNNISVTGGSMSGVTISDYVATAQKGIANGVATLDGSGTVPVSQLPSAVLGALSYQGTWNANTNTPTLTSSVGTKGYYYVVSVAGSTNLNGITDWQVGDWAVYNGSVWQKVDNTDAGGDVVGPASATDNAIARFDTTTGKLIQNSVVVVNDAGTMSGVESLVFDGSIPAATPVGTMWYDGATETLNFQQNNITQQIGEELFVYGKASAAITDSPLQIIYHTGTVGSSGVITFAPTIAGITDENAIIGVATESIALNGFGRITAFGVVHGITTNGTAFGETWADDDVIWYNPVTGNPTKVKPVAPNIKFQIGTVISAGSGGSGSFQVNLVQGTQLGGTDSNVQITSPTAAQLLTYSTSSGYWKNTSLASGTGISTSTNANGTLTVTNTAPDQTVALSNGTGISVTGTYPNFTITNTAPSSGGTVTSVSGTTGRITSTGGTTPVIDLASGVATAGTTGSSSLIPVVTIDTYGRVTGITTASNPQGTVTSVGGTGTVSGISLSGTVTSSGNLTLGGTLDLSSPPAIGGTTPAAITGTTITATKFVGVSGGTF